MAEATRHPVRKSPEWLLKVSVAFLAGTALFIMGLIVMAVAGYPVPQQSQPMVVYVLAIGAGVGAAAMGGHLTLSGTLPASFVGAPLVMSAGSGIAVFVLVLLLAPRLIPPPSRLDLRLSGVTARYTGDAGAERLSVEVRFPPLTPAPGYQVFIELGAQAECSAGSAGGVYRAPIDTPSGGQMLVLLQRNRTDINCVRLLVEDGGGVAMQAGPTKELSWSPA